MNYRIQREFFWILDELFEPVEKNQSSYTSRPQKRTQTFPFISDQIISNERCKRFAFKSDGLGQSLADSKDFDKKE